MSLTKCSYCGKVVISDHAKEVEMWVEEAAELKDYPLYTHGICPPCFEVEINGLILSLLTTI